MVSFYHRNSNIKIASCFITDFPGCILFVLHSVRQSRIYLFFCSEFFYLLRLSYLHIYYRLYTVILHLRHLARVTSAFIQFYVGFKRWYGILRVYYDFHMVLLHLSYGPVLIQLSHGLLGTHTVILRFHTAFILWLFHDFTKAFTRFYHGFQPFLLRLSNGLLRLHAV